MRPVGVEISDRGLDEPVSRIGDIKWFKVT